MTNHNKLIKINIHKIKNLSSFCNLMEMKFYILGKKRRLLVFKAQNINRDELEVESFFMETSLYASRAGRYRKSMQLEHHF